MIKAAVMPLASIAKDKETALGYLNVQDLIDEANKNATWVKPAAGSFSRLADIEGFLLAGAPCDIVRDVRAYQQLGAELMVFDLRFRYRDWYKQIDLLGKEVLPAL